MQFSKVHHLMALAASSFIIHTCAQAQERDKVRSIEEIVVTSSRIPQALRQVATSMSVINAEGIAAHGNLALTDVLRQLPQFPQARQVVPVKPPACACAVKKVIAR